MWLLAAAFTLLFVMGGIYETLALKLRRWPSITAWTASHPHAAILGFTGLGLAFGYALGRGGS